MLYLNNPLQAAGWILLEANSNDRMIQMQLMKVRPSSGLNLIKLLGAYLGA
jgi:hypothetical protein